MKTLFTGCTDAESKYEKIIELGRSLPPTPASYHTDENLVRGCQSKMYLHSKMEDGKVLFEAASDSLISAGLAAIMLLAYSGETPEAILKCEPTFLEDLGINASLTMNRSNGLASLHLRMKRDALQWLMQPNGS